MAKEMFNSDPKVGPPPRDFSGGGLTFEELTAALRNIGYDLKCARCAEAFYTGCATVPHDEYCATTMGGS